MSLVKMFRDIEREFMINDIQAEIHLSPRDFSRLIDELRPFVRYGVNPEHGPTEEINFMSLKIYKGLANG